MATDKGNEELDEKMAEAIIIARSYFTGKIDEEVLEQLIADMQAQWALKKNQTPERKIALLRVFGEKLLAAQVDSPATGSPDHNAATQVGSPTQVIVVETPTPTGASRANVIRPRRAGTSTGAKVGLFIILALLMGVAIFIAFSLINQPQAGSNRPVVATATATTLAADSQSAEEAPLVDTAMPTPTPRPSNTPRPTSPPTETPCVGACAIATGEANQMATRRAYSDQVHTATAVQLTLAASTPTP